MMAGVSGSASVGARGSMAMRGAPRAAGGRAVLRRPSAVPKPTMGSAASSRGGNSPRATPDRNNAMVVQVSEEVTTRTDVIASTSGSNNDDLPRASIDAIMAPVASDLTALNENLRNVVGERHPMLRAAADQIFGAGGKKLRPVMVFLVARATAQLQGLEDLTPKHRKIAEVIEMLHTASLVHDDVLDDCELRRGKSTVHSLYGTRVAVLAGDFLFAQASWFLANLENMEVIKLISEVIADFANGEISQASSMFDTEVTLEGYCDKSFYKTASLIAAGCRSAAAFSGCDEDVKAAVYDYGKRLGIAFQVVDDILDFTQTEEQLGKPPGQDLASGNLTAPVIFAMQHPVYGDELVELIESEFQEEGSLERSIELVSLAGGLEMAREFARSEGNIAREQLQCLPMGEHRKALEGMVDYVLDRIY